MPAIRKNDRSGPGMLAVTDSVGRVAGWSELVSLGTPPQAKAPQYKMIERVAAKMAERRVLAFKISSAKPKIEPQRHS